MNIYGIYDMKEKEQCLRVGTLQEIVNFLNLTSREAAKLALKGVSKVRHQYEIAYLFTEKM